MPEAIAAFLEPIVDCIVPCAVATIASLAVGLSPYGNLCGEGYPIVALAVVPLLARVSVNADIIDVQGNYSAPPICELTD